MLCWHYRALVVEAAQLLQNPRDLRIVSTLEDGLGINIDDIYGIEQQVSQQREQIRKEIETATKQTLAGGVDRLCTQSAGDEDLRILLHDLRGLSEQADMVMADAMNQFARSFGSLLDRQCRSMVLRDRIACANQTIKEMRERGIPELMQRCLAVGKQPLLIGALVAYPVKATDVRELVEQCSGIIQLLTTKDSQKSSTVDSTNSRADSQQKVGKPASASGEKNSASSSSNEKSETVQATAVTGQKINQGGSEMKSVVENSTSISSKTNNSSSPSTIAKETRNSLPLTSQNIEDSHELQEVTPSQQDAMQVISDLSQVFKETDVVIPEFMRDLFPGIDAGYRSLRGQ